MLSFTRICNLGRWGRLQHLNLKFESYARVVTSCVFLQNFTLTIGDHNMPDEFWDEGAENDNLIYDSDDSGSDEDDAVIAVETAKGKSKRNKIASSM